MRCIRDFFPASLISSQELAGVGLSPRDELDDLKSAAVAQVAALAAQNLLAHQLTPLGRLLPGLHRWRNVPLRCEFFRTRSYNAMRAADIATWGDVAAQTPAQLASIRNAGESTVKDIVARSVEQLLARDRRDEEPLLNRGETVDSDGDVGEGERFLSMLRALAEEGEARLGQRKPEESQEGRTEPRPNSPNPWVEDGVRMPIGYERQPDDETELGVRLLALVRTMAAWAITERGVRNFASIWQVSPDAGTIPADLKQLWDQFGHIELQRLADPELLDATLDDLAERFLAGLDERQRIVHRRRVIEGATLTEVGNELGVSRERIRQLQQKVDRRGDTLLRSLEFRPLRWRAADLRSSLGVTAPVAADVTRLALERSLRGASPEAAELLRPLILRLAGPFRERDGWMTLQSAEIPEASAVKEMADEFGVIPLASAYEWLAERGVRSEFHDAWLEHAGRFRRSGDHLLVWSGNIADKCVALLASRGEPADAETLVGLVAEGHSVTGTRNRLFEDERTVRVNRTDWALRAWEMEEYTGITDEIAQRIEEAGGSIEVDAVVRELVRQFRAREQSVLIYTGAPMFVIEGGLIRLRRDDEPFEVGGTLTDCTGAFRSSDSTISLLIPVDADLLRGSGRPLSSPVAVALRVVPGRPRSFVHADGELKVTWPMTSATGPSLGSARVIATSSAAVEGDWVRLDFDLEDGRVSAERVPPELDAYEDIEAIRLLTGISVELGAALVSVASAIGAEPAHVRRALNKRGDKQLAGLLPAPEADPRLRSTLSELARVIASR